MTDQTPSPPLGGHPPISPPPPLALPKKAYTPWIARVLAFLIDAIPVLILFGIGMGMLLGVREKACYTDISPYDLGEFCTEGASTLGQVSATLGGLLILAYGMWNYGYRQGTTGSSIGKSIMKFKVVSERTWQPIGFGLSIVRQLAHFVDLIICYLGYLFPLWDSKRQTLADKIMITVCVPR
jgi:uncharacterized RDD family membrane protein YckC